MTIPKETTAGVSEARRALIDSRRAVAVTSQVVADVAGSLNLARAWREENHIAAKLRAIIRGETYNANL